MTGFKQGPMCGMVLLSTAKGFVSHYDGSMESG